MSKLKCPRRLVAAATLAMLVLAAARPAYAGTRLATPGAPAMSSQVFTPATPVPAAHANGMRTADTQACGSLPGPDVLHAVAAMKPIVVGTPVPVLPNCTVTAPGTSPLQATASAVTVQWYDRSNNELGFQVFRRDLSGNWQIVYQVASRDVRGTGTGYSWVDTSTNLSGQCYMIAAYNTTDVGDTAEECTVRPDPSRFPQTIPFPVLMWGGLTDVNDGTGSLFNADTFQNLRYANRTFGVNLTWGNSSLWRVEAQGGPHLMIGQALALKVWGGGWLKYGHETFGVDLQFSSTPVYQWYAIGGSSAGSALGCAACALWNSAAHAYLIPGDQTWGVGLTWTSGASPSPSPTPPPARGVKTEQVLNCAADQQAVEVWIQDQTAGGAFTDLGSLDADYGPAGCPEAGSAPITFSPQSGHQYLLVATDSSLDACSDDDPRESACQAMVAPFVGDTHGFTRTDIVGGRTIITP